MDANILEGFIKEEDFAKANGLTRRSVARYREQGLPWMRWGREIWIDVEGGRQWLKARVQRAGFDPDKLKPLGFQRVLRRAEAPDGPPK